MLKKKVHKRSHFRRAGERFSNETMREEENIVYKSHPHEGPKLHA